VEIELVTVKLRTQQRQWNHLGQVDPFWAILSDPRKRHGGWSADEFFATGRDEVRDLMRKLEGMGHPKSRSAALDFGCGVGRLTFALTEWFDTVTGIDIAPSMIEAARRLSLANGRCQFLLNDNSDLSLLRPDGFDLIYSNIVLQHIPEKYARSYIAEFIRVLRPGGIAVFQAPSKLRSRSRVSRFGYRLNLFLRRRIRRDPFVLEMYGVPRETVEDDLANAGATLLQACPDQSARPEWDGYRYFVTK
jgi:SAM-dependent methyltransferase